VARRSRRATAATTTHERAKEAAMVKVLTFLKRKAGMPVDEFQAYWRTRHPDVVLKLPGVRRYVQSHTVPGSYAKGEPVYDGIAEVWADDTDALRAMSRSPAYAAVQADEAAFIDRASMGVLVTEEHVVRDGTVDADAVKAIEFLARRPDRSVDDFQRHWRERHGPLLAAIPGLRRGVLSVVRRAVYDSSRVPAWDGVNLMWFGSPADLRSAAGSPEYAAAVADRAQFLAPGQPPFIMTREHVVLG
jgi:uncharacterized protein (TIGR02118 family)